MERYHQIRASLINGAREQFIDFVNSRQLLSTGVTMDDIPALVIEFYESTRYTHLQVFANAAIAEGDSSRRRVSNRIDDTRDLCRTLVQSWFTSLVQIPDDGDAASPDEIDPVLDPNN